jgi:hypothetical protein
MTEKIPLTTQRTLSADEYHADLTGDPRPSLSASIATILCQSSPAHARAAHPRLNPNLVREDTAHFDLGTVVHDLLLEDVDKVVVVDFDDWRKKAAQEERDAARAAGQIPLLAKHYDEVQRMVAAAREQIAALDVNPTPFTDGKPEQPLVWEEDGVLCRARLDWLRDDHLAIDDFKTSGRSANPENFSRSLFDHGYDIQAVLYRRAVKALYGVEAEWRWIVQETSAPYALSVVSPGPDVLVIGEKKVRYALHVWRQCLKSDLWPAYPTRVCYATVPAYEESRWLEKELREFGVAA